MTDLQRDPLSDKIIGCAIEVHKRLGPGLLESVYELPGIAGGDWMKITLSVLSMSLAGVLSGCSPVVSVQPLYTQADIQRPYLNQRVEGEWIMANLETTRTGTPPHPNHPAE